MAMGTLSVLYSGIDGLGGFELFLTLSTTVFVEWHGIPSFLHADCGKTIRSSFEALRTNEMVMEQTRFPVRSLAGQFHEWSRSALDKLPFCKRS
jgi:hypothetical protein